MKPDDKARDAEAREVEAAEWLCERAEGFTPERAAAFHRWSAADPRNAVAAMNVERTLELLDEMPAVRAPLEAKYGRPGPVDFTGEMPSRKRVGRFQPWWAAGLAAAVALTAIGGWTVFQRPRASAHFITAMAEPQRVALQDGSVVDLNGASEVRVTFSAEKRNVTLGAGEAHFEVAHDPLRPFVVTAGRVSVRAIGTAFNVRVVGESVDVIVTKGKVEIVRQDGKIEQLAPVLVAGERLQIPTQVAALPPVEKVAPEAMRTLLAWQEKTASFTDLPLQELVARFNLRNEFKLVLDDAELGARKIGGVMAFDQVEAFVRLLEQDGDIIAVRTSENQIVLRRAR